MERYTLIITEKPDAAQRIAEALDNEGEPKRVEEMGVPYFLANRDRKLVVVPALGHLYTVVHEVGGRNHYPVFNFKWAPRYVAEKGAKQIKTWIEVISKLAKNADAYIDACVSPDTIILTEDSETLTIADLEKCWQHHRVLGFYEKTKSLSDFDIERYMKLNPKKIGRHVFKLTAESGRHICATDDHRFYTPRGWVPLNQLKSNDRVAVYPLRELTPLAYQEQTLITEEDIWTILNNLLSERSKRPHSRYRYNRQQYFEVMKLGKGGLTYRKISEETGLPLRTVRRWLGERKVPYTVKNPSIEKLKKMGLLPLTTKHEKIDAIMRLLGGVFGDGCLYALKKKWYAKGAVFMCEISGGVEEVESDLRSLGFNFIREGRERIGFINGRRFRQKCKMVMCNSLSLWLLLYALGAPSGVKTDITYEIPRWLLAAPPRLQREFLSTMLGGDLVMPRVSDVSPKSFSMPDIRFNKLESLVHNGRKLADQIATLLGNLGVTVSSISIKPAGVRRKDGAKTVCIRLMISNSRKNLHNLFHKVGIKYCTGKKNLGLLIAEYQKLKLNQPIGKIPTFKKWVRNATFRLGNSGLVWERVQSIVSVQCSDVRDITVSKVHNFIANGFLTHNCDYDLEGSLIGYCILKYTCENKEGIAKRMKFSTLTKGELEKAYGEPLPQLDFAMIEAGRTRHEMDWLYGVNLSRALTLAAGHWSGRYTTLSTGRVQGPTLRLLVGREREIRSFVPTPYWVILAEFQIGGTVYDAKYEMGVIEKRAEADAIVGACVGKDGVIESIEVKRFEQAPPIPFDLGALQTEAYGLFGYTPRRTADIAERLYLGALISYPRTSVDYDENIFIIDEYGETHIVKIGNFVDSLLQRSLDVQVHGEHEILPLKWQFKTFVVDPHTFKVVVKPISAVIRHPVMYDLYEVRTRGGRAVRVTADHSLFTWHNGNLIPIPTKNLKVGDYIIVIKNVQFNQSLSSISLIDEIIKQGIENHFTLVNWKNNKQLLQKSYQKGLIEGANYRFRNAIPLNIALKLVGAEDINAPRLRIRARSGKNEITLPLIMQMTPEIARLLGYFTSEGCSWYKQGNKSCYEVALRQYNFIILKDMEKSALAVFGDDIKIDSSCTKIRVYGKTPLKILQIFNLGEDAMSKRVPEVILSAPPNIIAEYLKAYFAGDGTVSKDTVEARTVSRELANGIVFLLLHLGIFATLERCSPSKVRQQWHYRIVISGTHNLARFYNFVGVIKESHKAKLEQKTQKINLVYPTRINSIPKSALTDWSQLYNPKTTIHKTKHINLFQLQKIEDKIKVLENLLTPPQWRTRLKMILERTSLVLKDAKSLLQSDIGLSEIVSIERVQSTRSYVYDISVDGYENFLGGLGCVLLHNSSQKLPPVINYRAILHALGRETMYKDMASDLLAREELKPHEGKREDPAHPAIYPTGNLPERALNDPEKRVWDLIVRRFMAVFGEPAIKQGVRVFIAINGHHFYLRGRQVLKEGWMRFYKPYIRTEEVLLPPIKEGDIIQLKRIMREDKFTKPPPRYNPSSLLRKMEDIGIGTKATRADIIETLYDRRYIMEERIMVTDLGFDVVDILRKYCPGVISVKLTRELEERMEQIQRNSEKRDNVLVEAVDRLKPMLEGFKEREEMIGLALSNSIKKARMQERVVGSCPNCNTGQLMILYSRRTGKRFIGCTNYFKGLCKTSFPLPQRGAVKPARKGCRACGWPIVQVRTRIRRPWMLCINPNCPLKEQRKLAIGGSAQ